MQKLNPILLQQAAQLSIYTNTSCSQASDIGKQANETDQNLHEIKYKGSLNEQSGSSYMFKPGPGSMNWRQNWHLGCFVAGTTAITVLLILLVKSAVTARVLTTYLEALQIVFLPEVPLLIHISMISHFGSEATHHAISPIPLFPRPPLIFFCNIHANK